MIYVLVSKISPVIKKDSTKPKRMPFDRLKLGRFEF